MYGFNERIYTLVLIDECYNLNDNTVAYDRYVINTNGIPNIAFKKSEWIEYVKNSSLVWTNTNP
jgi:hypothetical protein